jgi:uncharacterized metal-binding protein
MILDGCETACAKTILENAGVPVKEHIIYHDLYRRLVYHQNPHVPV